MVTQINRAPGRWWGMSALAGLIGGAVMALYEMIYFLSTYGVFWLPMNMVGAIFPGYRPPGPVFSAGPSLTGICLHLLVAAAFGLAYGAVVGAFFPLSSRSWRGSLVLGLVWGTLVWGVMALALSPLLPTYYAVEAPPTLYIANLLYGLTTAFFLYALERRERVIVTFFPETVREEEPAHWI